jgi:putative colanic acid biosynthesis glycosyltransferase
MFTHHQAMLYKRERVSELRYDLRYKISADYDFTGRFLKRAQHILYCPFALCDFKPGGISQKNVRQGRTEQFSIRQNLALCAPIKNALIYGMQSTAMTFRHFTPGLYWLWRKEGFMKARGPMHSKQRVS